MFMETEMDTERWKSVLTPREVYDELKKTAREEGRTISGQLRYMFEVYKNVTPTQKMDVKIKD
jgi:hypothetical protein|tara:strand:- start:835 stop:1023 length:189 start_codon:yes stop_codon:yes gene_type:complete